MSENKVKSPFFYGWWIVLGGFLIMATCYTIFVNCIPLFQASIVRDLHLTVGEFNTGVSLCTAVAIFASLAIGVLLDKRSVRVMGTVTVLVTVVVLVLFYFIEEPWHLYALCIVAGMVVVAGTRLLISVLTTNWFTLKRGLAVSIALAGSGAGGVILSPVTAVTIEELGWRWAFILLAAITLVAALPLTVITFRNHPADKGLQPYGQGMEEKDVKLGLPAWLPAWARRRSGSAGSSGSAARRPEADAAVTVAVGWKVLLRRWGFWLLILGFVMMGFINGAVITNAVSNMTAMTLDGTEVVVGGHDPVWASAVWSVYLAMVIVGKICLGAIYDRWGLKAGTVVGTAACMLASVALCFPQSDIAPVLAALTFGFGTCMGTVSPPVMVVKEYGKKDLGTVTGIVTALELAGAAVGAVVSGRIFDAFHSFVPAWLLTLAAGAVMGFALLLSVPAAKRIVERCKAAGAPELK